jgi:hypothetical protein
VTRPFTGVDEVGGEDPQLVANWGSFAFRGEHVNSKGNPDPAIRKARSKFGVAVRELDEEKAAEAARELVQARRVVRIRELTEALTASGAIEADDTEA